jgi:hypothetical protein
LPEAEKIKAKDVVCNLKFDGFRITSRSLRGLFAESSPKISIKFAVSRAMPHVGYVNTLSTSYEQYNGGKFYHQLCNLHVGKVGITTRFFLHLILPKCPKDGVNAAIISEFVGVVLRSQSASKICIHHHSEQLLSSQFVDKLCHFIRVQEEDVVQRIDTLMDELRAARPEFEDCFFYCAKYGQKLVIQDLEDFVCNLSSEFDSEIGKIDLRTTVEAKGPQKSVVVVNLEKFRQKMESHFSYVRNQQYWPFFFFRKWEGTSFDIHVSKDDFLDDDYEWEDVEMHVKVYSEAFHMLEPFSNLGTRVFGSSLDFLLVGMLPGQAFLEEMYMNVLLGNNHRDCVAAARVAFRKMSKDIPLDELREHLSKMISLLRKEDSFEKDNLNGSVHPVFEVVSRACHSSIGCAVEITVPLDCALVAAEKMENVLQSDGVFSKFQNDEQFNAALRRWVCVHASNLLRLELRGLDSNIRGPILSWEELGFVEYCWKQLSGFFGTDVISQSYFLSSGRSLPKFEGTLLVDLHRISDNVMLKPEKQLGDAEYLIRIWLSSF